MIQSKMIYNFLKITIQRIDIMSYDRIVIKIGTSTITNGSSNVDMPKLIDLTRQISWMMHRGIQVTLVSSGAVAAGREILNFPHLSKHIPGKQMLSAIGQPRLMSIYMELFRMYGIVVSQILLTRSDFTNRKSYLNARNTLDGLLSQNVLPVINENDTIATDEIRLGDNDTMSAFVSGLIGADLLVLLTDQDGLFDSNPETDATAKVIKTIDSVEIPPAVWEAAGGSASGLGTGGMITKVRAADIARRMGTSIMIANGKVPDILIRIAAGERFGTVFRPTNTVLESKKRFLLTGFRSNNASIRVDNGAVKAILSGKSLLPAGIKEVTGEFDRGDTVRMVGPDGHEFAVGMVNYASNDLQKIIGLKANEIEGTLGYTFADEVIHHDFMIVD